MIEKDVGICIRKVDYSDTSQILTFFCRENGKVSGIAKGAKRRKSKFGGAVELLSIGELLFSNSPSEGLAGIREFSPQGRFIGLRRSLLKMNSGMFAAELVNHFSQEHMEFEQLFDIFCQLLDNLQTAENDPQTLTALIIFQLSLLECSGIGMILDRCSNCGNKKYLGPYISPQANGLICNDCQMTFIDKVRLSNKAVSALTNRAGLTKSDWNTLCEIERALVHYFSQIMHKQPMLANYFNKLS